MKGKLKLQRYFSQEGVNPLREVEWNKSDLRIMDEKGNHLFTQKGSEFPSQFSQKAKDIIGSRYFYGEQGTSERENSFETLLLRVNETYEKWGIKQKYFDEKSAGILKDELNALCVNQVFSFNSPTWFNVGTDKYPSKVRPDKEGGYTIVDGETQKIGMGQTHLYPQTSACFIQHVDDTMEDIMDLSRREAMLFKDGSGTGTDLSTLRSKREKLSGGGNPSGPLAYLVFFDDVAGIVKSGGKTRRAAKMISLKVGHPEIYEFIVAKKDAQKIIRTLITAGYDPVVASEKAHYQNTNLSVRVTDEFMNAVKNDLEWQTVPVHNKELKDEMPRYKAKDLLDLIAEGAWECGDPGMQYEDTINEWHTCPNSDRINASNPCSEYMFIDDSACNLASLNLMKFRTEEGGFDHESFKQAINVVIPAMDLNIDNSSYPTEPITKNSHLFRPLGLGYSNLGSLMMSLGLPYDSDGARAVAAAITAFMTGEAYKTSAELAKEIGTFKEYELNKEPMLKVMKKHADALDEIEWGKLPSGFKGLESVIKQTWEDVLENGKNYGFRNAQTTVLAPTGTISFMMDCDTLGIEPELGLVKTKRLAEGGKIKIINNTVGIALERLGYDKDQIKSIKKYIIENKTIEGSILKEEHLPIFDCSMDSEKGKRSISYKGHIDMMASVQPFLSGAISKTINMPKDVTKEEIVEAYFYGWEKKLKAMAVYRDTSKALQPLTIEGQKDQSALERNKLPGTRDGVIHKFDIAGHEGYVTVGLYEDGTPGEVFIDMSKEGSTVGGLINDFAVAISLGLQYGVPLEKLCTKMSGNKYEPSGFVSEGDTKNIRTAKSITDYIFRWMGYKFLKDFQENKQNITAYDPEYENNKKRGGSIKEEREKPLIHSGKFCPDCGEELKQRGSCEALCINPDCNHIDMTGCGG